MALPLGQRLIPTGVDFDTSPQYLKSDKAYFLKGIETSWVMKGGNAQNSAELKPAESNYLFCSVPLPSGTNTVIGYYYYIEGNEGYVVVHNSNGYHLIYRLRGIDGQCQIVYNFCQNFKGIINKPKYFFSEGRMEMKSLCRYLPDGSQELYKELYLVNKKVDNLRIVVEDSIATNSFTTAFFTSTDQCCGDRCRLIKTGVPTPMGQITIKPIAPTAADKLLQNTMLSQMFQFRFVDENAWGQRSEHGLISDPYFNSLAGCSKDAANQPHCVWLETKTPCPEIVKRTVEVRSCQKKVIVGTDGNLVSDWKEAFHIDLYDKSNPNLKWYERQYDTTNKEFEFFNNGKSMRIKFCNNRECKTITDADVRNQNPAPITSGTVVALGKGLAYGDNENDLDPFQKQDIDSVSVALEPTKGCDAKYSRIIVWAVVHNLIKNRNNPTYKRNGRTAFGGYGHDPLIGNTEFEENVADPEIALTEKGGHGQYFPDGVNGFRAGLAGTDITTESVQYLYTPSSITKLGVLDDTLDNYKAFVSQSAPNKKWAIQKFDFGMVRCGTYRFRIFGHNDTENLPATSTYYIHTTTFGQYKQNWGIVQNNQKEIFIDTTDGFDFDSMAHDQLAVIADLTHPQNTFSNGTKVLRGYFYESRDNKLPIELAEVKVNQALGTLIGTPFTDHNGFYFKALLGVSGYKVQLFSPEKCNFGFMLGQTGDKKKEGTTLAAPLYATDRAPNYLTDLCSRYFITGTITECGGTAGIEGIAVVLARTNPVYTNSKGEFKVIAHYSNGRGSDDVIFSVGGKCHVVDCNCKPVKVIIPTMQPVCVNCAEKTIPVGNYKLQAIITQGQPHGSRIQIGMTGWDWLGRPTGIQTSEKLFLDIPTEQEQGNSTYPKIKIKLPPKFTNDICTRFKYITFWWSKNTNYDDWSEWAADKVDFIDIAGNKNVNSPSKIKIWYKSLNAYNLIRGLNTNNAWNIIDTNNNTRLGDTVEFIQDVDGVYFPPNTEATVQYDKDGTYFLIDYDESLKNVKDGVKFKLRRPYQCETAKTFYEFGFPINFCQGDCIPRDDNGNVVTEFYLTAFASYMIPRQIPVVTEVIEQVPATGGGTQDKITEVKNIKVYPFLFEHHSPSDSWGDHCNSGGRINYINPYEGKKCDRTQILLTGALNQANDGAINYLHYFSLEDDFVLDEDGFGRITAILVRSDQQILVVCEFTTFSFRYNDNRAVVDEQGYIKVPTNNRFSRPERNPFFNFGCQENDINTIRRIDSTVTFLDSQKQAIVLHDFNSAIDISQGIQSWLVPSIKEVRKKPDTMYWHSCFDMRLKKIFFTKFNLTTQEYVNNEIEKRPDLHETMAYNFETKEWNMSNFTPEYLGSMHSDLKDTQFFSFQNGRPYAHHNAVDPGTVYLNYFGIQCFPVIGVVTNEKGTAEKSFTANQVYCREILFILEQLETSMGQKSKVYEGAWEFGAGCSMAAYHCDTDNPDACNTAIQSSLLDGDTLLGKWLKSLYIPNPDYKGEYFLLTEIVSFYFGR